MPIIDTLTDVKGGDNSSLRYDYSLDSFDETSHYGRLLQRVGHNKKVLELGSSTGYLTSAMSEKFGCTVIGVEVDNDAAIASRARGHEVLVLDLDKANLKEELAGHKFDVVLCADVLEHLRSPEETLRQLATLLNEDGYVICSIPHVGHGDIKLSLLTGRLPYRPMGLLDHTHMKFFTRALLEELFESAGFCLEKVERNRWQLTKTEVQGRLPMALVELGDFIASDPESETYQFIVKARPYRPEEKLAAQQIEKAATDGPPTDLERVDIVVIDQDSERADDLYQKYLGLINYPQSLLRFWFVSADAGLVLADKPKGQAAAYGDSDFRTFRFTGMGSRDQQMVAAAPIAGGGKKLKLAGDATPNVAATLAQVARGSDARYLFVLLANALPGANCLRHLVAAAANAPRKSNGKADAAWSELIPLIAARPEIRPPQESLPQGGEQYLAWHGFSGMLIPRDYLLELKSLDPQLWTVQAQAADMCFRAWSCGRPVIECPEANYFTNGPQGALGDYDDTVADGLRLRRRWGTSRNILAFAKYAAGRYGRGQPLVWLKTANHVLAALAIETPLRAALPEHVKKIAFAGPGASEIGQTADSL